MWWSFAQIWKLGHTGLDLFWLHPTNLGSLRSASTAQRQPNSKSANIDLGQIHPRFELAKVDHISPRFDQIRVKFQICARFDHVEVYQIGTWPNSNLAEFDIGRRSKPGSTNSPKLDPTEFELGNTSPSSKRTQIWSLTRIWSK